MTDSMVREALEPFAKVARYMFVSGHCGGASPKDFPLKWNVHLDIGPSNFSPQQGAPLLTVADFQRASEALAALASEPGVSGDAARLVDVIDARIQGRHVCHINSGEWLILSHAICARLSRQQPAGEAGRQPDATTLAACIKCVEENGDYLGIHSSRIVEKLRALGTFSPASTPQPANPNAMRDERSGTKLTLDNDEQVFFYEQDFYVLSNFSAFTVQWKGLRFDTSEAAYHWEKFPGQERAGLRDEIWTARSAHEAFKIAERNKAWRRQDWDVVKVDIMADILRAKAGQHEYVRRKLLETGNRVLIENSWRDDFWGWGSNRDGLNMLGRLWMDVRAELHALNPAPSSVAHVDETCGGKEQKPSPSPQTEG
jgi:hypothetical protein